ncbi:MAG: hypothetical protein AB8B63_04850 [Granulosicoccus sp.]
MKHQPDALIAIKIGIGMNEETKTLTDFEVEPASSDSHQGTGGHRRPM